ncbi:LOW QUALITY PROTEIN: regenerating islet-derived protein 4 [Geospiza fortis]|uniref:LOW QUALITY PROTEIN: regenerating islet-derived protein 4 n=1 Tax=Geospiza fortis TaxID=48883 RepID=A0A6I9ZC52_GEOFO|nr:LOW QUALITY PROTEIN: regenerating islet-derived protein 4 [Geospiza fortis]
MLSRGQTDADEQQAIKGSSSPLPSVTRHKPLFLAISGQQSKGRYIGYCPAGWSYYKLSCFKYFSEPRSWDEAESRCQDVKKGAHLAWVEDDLEAATLRRTIFYYQHVQPVWIGLQKSKESQAWHFSVWSSADCSRQHPYICKFYPLH